MFSLKGRETTPLYFRVIKVDPNSFEEGIRKFLGVPESDGGAGDKASRSLGTFRLFRQVCDKLGVDMSGGKSIFYGDREGSLLVYATLDDLDKIENWIRATYTAAAQLNIKAVFLQLSKAQAQSFWEEFGYTNLPASSGSVRTTTLTDSEAQALSRRWESQGGTHILGRAQVTTLDGRQVQVSVQDVLAMVTRDAQGQAKPGNVSLGPTLDVIPYVSADGFSVQMTLIPSLAEFIGYDDPGPFANLIQTIPPAGSSVPVSTQAPLPHFRIRQVTTSVNVWDGQTVAVGNFTTKDMNTLKEQDPALADLPIVGRLFRNEPAATNNTEVLVFVTPRIIDPAGNPIHSPPSE